MLARFSLYGFLKNQRYFEAFLVLAFLEKGLDFFAIGLLVAIRELTVNLVEIPSGALADVGGRRSAMILGFAAYIVSFAVLGLANGFAVLALGMVLYGVGDAFRTGTHKAMIFDWLHQAGREDERVKVYGYTRSWSKLGSAVSVVIAAVIVVVADGYRAVFLTAIVPYGLAIVNFLGYPRSLDRRETDAVGVGTVARHMLEAVRTAARRPRLRRLVLEAVGFDGVFGAVKDYLQPVTAALAVSIAVAMSIPSGPRQTRMVSRLLPGRERAPDGAGRWRSGDAPAPATRPSSCPLRARPRRRHRRPRPPPRPLPGRPRTSLP